MSNQTEHLDLFDQIIHTLVNMSESIDLLTGKMRGGCHQILMFGPESEFVGEGC
jgi:hypothetical protein